MPRSPSLFAAAALLSGASHAAVVWDEAVQGDLSDSGASPTFVALAGGSNQIWGAAGADVSGIDADYFSVVVPSGWLLGSLMVLDGTDPEGLGFIGVEAGPQVTATFSPAPLLGWLHYTVGDVGEDILQRIGSGEGAIGFSGPLPAGTYSFWVQDFDFGASPYRFELNLTLVPEPASALLLLAGIALLGVRRRAQRT